MTSRAKQNEKQVENKIEVEVRLLGSTRVYSRGCVEMNIEKCVKYM